MLAETVRRAASRFEDAPALIPENGAPISFRELDRRSDAAAAGLARRRVGRGDVAALCMSSGPAYVIAYAALAKLGAATVGVNPRFTPSERRSALQAAGPDHVIIEPGLAEGIPADLPTIEGIPDDGDPDGATRRPTEPRALLAIVLTSGTTGPPKGAMFTARQLEAIARMDWGDHWGGGASQLVATEMAHIGFMTKLPWYLRSGGPMHLLERWTPRAALRVVARERIPVVGGIAAQIALLLRDPSFDDHDLSNVRLIVAGGGRSSPELVLEALERFGAGYSIRYSSTESGGLGTMTDPGSDDPAEIDSVGLPRPGIEIQIRDGEVWLRSPAVMSGYRNDPEATARTLVDGWLRTGDAGQLDPQGRLRLSGRRAERYRRGGYFVHPAEVEAVLAEHPGVEDVAIVPRPDEVYGQIGVAVVVPSDPAAPPSLESLRAFGAASRAAYQLTAALRVRDGLPLTSMHKVDRRRLAREEADPAHAGSTNERSP